MIQQNALLRKQENSVSVLKCLLLFVHLEIKVLDVLSVGNCQLLEAHTTEICEEKTEDLERYSAKQ